MQDDGGDEAQSAGPVGERADGAGTPLDLDMESLDAIGSSDSFPVLLRKREVARRSRKAVLETLDGLRNLFHPTLFKLGLGFLGVDKALALEDGREFVGQALPNSCG